MAEYIEREAIKYELWAVGPLNSPMMLVRKKTIDSIPAADVAPVVHGEWVERVIERSDLDGDWLALEYHCSLCGRVEYRKEPYCHCGAKMDGEGKGE